MVPLRTSLLIDTGAGMTHVFCMLIRVYLGLTVMWRWGGSPHSQSGVEEAAGGRGRAGFSKGLPQSTGRLRIVQVLQGFQGNLDKDRNTLKVNTGESAQLLVALLSFINSAYRSWAGKSSCFHSSLRCKNNILLKEHILSFAQLKQWKSIFA